MSVDFMNDDYQLFHLSGSWIRECQLNRKPLTPGIYSIESTRGASSAVHNPFIALLRKETGEHQGEAYRFSFVYSSNFLARVQVSTFAQTRVMMGINPFDFNWLLQPGEAFQTPEVVLVYSERGLNRLSRTYHRLYRKRLARGKYRDRARPVLVNNWEATYFDFDDKKLLES